MAEFKMAAIIKLIENSRWAAIIKLGEWMSLSQSFVQLWLSQDVRLEMSCHFQVESENE